jgi:uncharacterized membrane protein
VRVLLRCAEKMNTSAKSQFPAIPVIFSSLVATLLGTIIIAPTADFMSWIFGAGVAIIPMGFILAYSIQRVRRQQVAYSLFRAVLLGFIVGFLSVSSILLIHWVIIPGIFLLYKYV